jgi:hypothetical protein
MYAATLVFVIHVLIFLQLQKCLGQYLFVKKYSGVGWDDEDNHATATPEFIETFLKVCFLHDVLPYIS